MGVKIKDTKIGQWLKDKAPDALDVVGDLLPDSGALGIVKNVLDKVNPEASKEFDQHRATFEKEMYQLEIQDRDSARQREVQVLKAGGTDWMMNLSGIVALATFVTMVLAVIFKGDLGENALFHQLMGIIEGVALTVFAYYFGTSKGSRDKDEKK